MRWLVLALLGGCTTYDPTWELRAAITTQPLTRAELGIADQVPITPGSAWLSIHSYGTDDVVYPIVDDASGLRVESPFDAAATEQHGDLVTSTRLSRDTEPAEQHPSRQYATLFIDAVVDAAIRDTPTADNRTLTIELDIPVPETCKMPFDAIAGTVEGCLDGVSCPKVALAREGGGYRMGPLIVALEVLPQMCLE